MPVAPAVALVCPLIPSGRISVILSSSPTIHRGKSLYEQVYQALRSAILTGQLPPGNRLVETQLAEWLQVSRTPLREALRQLQQEGLATADVSGGLRVTTITAADAAELYDCRLALECLAVAGACQNATTDQLRRIDACVAQADSLEARHHLAPTHHSQSSEALPRPTPENSPSPQQLLDVDYQFHHLIAESSGNRRLISLLDGLFDAMALLRIQTLKQNPEVLDIRLEHRQIYEAIAARDSDTAVTAIQSHLRASKARVIQEIEAYQPHS
jgi:DNA-binding GntR family transcriptional regulator